ncbi:MAG TPA: PP2C family protein-serine/threonine phosphatase [Acidimicrobiales bacterium]|nr:PP2C family protein-serine/threonine phosphatase [Acidimicrobiales bacterium]
MGRYRTSASVLLVGVATSVLLAWTARALYDDSEARQLRLRVRDAGTLIATSLRSVETPLTAGLAIATATGDSPGKFTSFASAYVGASAAFSSMSLWEVRGDNPVRVALAGTGPGLSTSRARVVLGRARRQDGLAVSYETGAAGRALGYSIAGGAGGRTVVLARARLPAHTRAPLPRSSAFADLDYALYLDTFPHGEHLLATSVAHLPLHGTAVRTPFGDASIDLVMSARGTLVGAFFEEFPWIVGGIGLALSIAAALLSQRLVHRRRVAELLVGRLDEIATENRRLYDEQRSIARSLQHALLPERLPATEGLEIAARYVAGARGLDVGGDWYDVIPIDHGRLLVVVGDVSGRGVHAATVMASLRFATRAYALQGDAPATILAKLSALVSVDDSGHFATAICALVDVAAHEISLANAGHPPPLLLANRAGRYIDADVGVPVGVVPAPAYETMTVRAPARATLLVFTDGLVERRGELLDVGLETVRARFGRDAGPLDETLTALIDDVAPAGLEDDAAMVGLRWTS